MSNFTRRDMLKGALVGTVAVGVGGLAVNTTAQAGVEASAEVASTYLYKNRRITVIPVADRSGDALSLMASVFIDDRPLHVMRRPDGRFTSVMNHFQTFPTLEATAQAAADALRGANLVPMHHK